MEQAKLKKEEKWKKYQELDLYIIQKQSIGNYTFADSLYQIRIGRDSSLEILNAYTKFLFEIGEIPKAKIINERVRMLSQLPVNATNTEGVAWGLYHYDAILSTLPDTLAGQICLKAIPLFKELAIRDTNYRIYVARLMSDLAQCKILQKKPEESLKIYLDAIKSFDNPVDSLKKTEYDYLKSYTLSGLAICYRDMNLPDSAVEVMERAIVIQKQLLMSKDSLKYVYSVCLLLNDLGTIHEENDEFEEAIDKINEGIALIEKYGEKKSPASERELTRAMRNLAYTHYRKKDDYSITMSLLNKTLEKAHLNFNFEPKFYTGIIISVDKIILQMLINNNNLDDGLEKCRTVIAELSQLNTFDTLKKKENIAYFSMMQGVLYLKKNDLNLAKPYFSNALQLYSEITNWRLAAECTIKLLDFCKQKSKNERKPLEQDIKDNLTRLQNFSERLKSSNPNLSEKYQQKYKDYKAIFKF